ncbi:MAG: GtrA family protein [Anaerolineaceae bacterium]|nr:GtrA family protein [Anaerolineaceae bacterium]
MIFANPKERTRFIRFAVVGIVGAVVDFGVFNLLLVTTAIEAVWASAISFIAAVISNFIWNRHWTYPDARGKTFVRQLFQFSLVSFLGLGIRIGLFALLEDFFIAISARWLVGIGLTPQFIGHNATLAIAILVVMLWNFFANRFWTYSEVQ